MDDILDGSSSDDDTPVCEAVKDSEDSDDSLDDLLDGSGSGEFPSRVALVSNPTLVLLSLLHLPT